MRLFAAVVPPPRVLDEVAAAISRARSACQDTAGAEDLRWTRRASWHLTIAFYGEVGDRQTGCLQRRLAAAAAQARPLRLGLAGAGQFGGGVLWVGVTGAVADLAALARAAAAAGESCGIPPEARPYRAHLTFARRRRERGASRRPSPALDSAVAALAGWSVEGWTAQEVVVLRSYLGPTPRYEPLATWALGADTSAGASGTSGAAGAASSSTP